MALYGEYELKLQHRQQRYTSNFVLFCDLRRPLTVEDYLKNSPTSVLTDMVTGVGEGVCAGVGTGADAGASASVGAGASAIGTLAVAVTAQPGPQT